MAIFIYYNFYINTIFNLTYINNFFHKSKLTFYTESLNTTSKDNNIDFEKFSEKELSKLMKDNLEYSKKLKKEINLFLIKKIIMLLTLIQKTD